LLIKTQPSGFSSRVALVTLQTPEEQALTNDQLMLIVDNHRGVSYDHSTETYRLNGEDFGAARHWGGSVKALGADPHVKCVTVNID
jgi:hypothetical protein